jgi:hypothetical protein
MQRGGDLRVIPPTDERRDSMPLRQRSFAFLLAVGLLTGAASMTGVGWAQTPPTSVSPQADTITHPPGSPSSTLPEDQSSQLQFTPAQKTAILTAIRKDAPKGASPVNFVAAVGSPVPPSIELYILPDGALAQVPEAKMVKYTTVQNQVVLVDPTTMRVVDVIRE